MRQIKSEKSIERLYKMIRHKSMTLTIDEKQYEGFALNLLEEIPYFKENPQHKGLHMIESDPIGRSIVWGYVDKGHAKTLVLYGHHDVVDVSVYGSLSDLAFNPDALKVQLSDLCQEARDDDWLFGRGSADMKAGSAAQLTALEALAQEEGGLNLLWLSLPDEENLSQGMRHAGDLLNELSHRFHMTYELAIQSEPHERGPHKEAVIHTGSVGKIMPMIWCKGVPVHCGELYNGFNPMGMMVEVIKAVNLNTEMSDKVEAEMVAPPTFLGWMDFRNQYNVTTPEIVGAYFNWLSLNNDYQSKMDQLKELCIWSIEDAINQYNYSYNQFLRKHGQRSHCERNDCEPYVLTFSELIECLPQEHSLEAYYQLWLNTGEHNQTYPHEKMFFFVKWLMEKVDIDKPYIVIGMMNTLYPAISSHQYYLETLQSTLQHYEKEEEYPINIKRFFMNISDMSFYAPHDEGIQVILDNMPSHFVEEPYFSKKNLAMPTINIGPWGKNLHLKTECVYKPDVEKHVPELICLVADILSQLRG